MTRCYSITTLGCKVNQAESEQLAARLKAMGLRESGRGPEGCSADICIINTCTVTQKASMQSRQAIRRSIRMNPKARIIVTGCYAQMQPEVIQAIEGVSDVVGHHEKSQIPDLIEIPANRPNASPPSASTFDPFMVEAANTTRTRPVLKIQDGCNAFCTYCIVPYSRGRSRSMPVGAVLDAVQQVRAAGKHEIVLSGIHLGCYGKELQPPTSLTALLDHILKTTSIERIRLSSIEPGELKPAIINQVAASKRLCHHFHIPLQSGDDAILQKMGRPYTRSDFSRLIRQIHAALPDAAIGVDVLVGFPGESQAAFDNTVSLVEKLPVSYLHVFPFSPRPGTPAFTFPNQVSKQVIRKRCQYLRQMGQRKKIEFYQKFIYQTVAVLVESKRDPKTGLLKGFTSNYIPVLIQGEDALQNRLVDVSLVRVDADGAMFGRLL